MMFGVKLQKRGTTSCSLFRFVADNMQHVSLKGNVLTFQCENFQAKDKSFHSGEFFTLEENGGVVKMTANKDSRMSFPIPLSDGKLGSSISMGDVGYTNVFFYQKINLNNCWI